MSNLSQTIYLTTSGVYTLSGSTPFTLTINPSGIDCVNKIYKIYYDYKDGSSHTQSFFPSNSSDYINSNLYIKNEPGDPRNYPQTKTFYQLSTSSQLYSIGLTSFLLGTSQTYNHTINLYLTAANLIPLSSLNGTISDSGFFTDLSLESTRMFGPNNQLLYIFKGYNPNYILPVILNWSPETSQKQTITNYYV